MIQTILSSLPRRRALHPALSYAGRLLALCTFGVLYAQESIFPINSTPAIQSDSDTAAVELGLKFRSAQAGRILGVKFFKGVNNTGTHTGSLWDATGKLLGNVQFTNETASGWQTATFAAPISIAANTTYVVSYFAPRGRYSINSNFFSASEVKSANLTALRSTTANPNGVYRYGNTSAFPSQSWNSSNYWVDVVFALSPPAAGMPTVSTPPSNPVVSSSIWPATTTPKTLASSDTQAVELGVKFRSTVAGTIRGVRFFKGAGNGGLHVARLYSREGAILATANFVNETPTGWQQANFATPVPIEANKVYIASYHAPLGRYSHDAGFFSNSVTNGSLTALKDGTDGGNGVYRYGPGGQVPNATYQSFNYWVDVSFTPSASTSGPTPPVVPQPTAPVITTQPANRTVSAGATANFSVAASGASMFTYQWQRNGMNIMGANAASYTTPATQTSDTGTSFRVIVSANGLSTTSAVATLTVNAVAPAITSQPVSRTVTVGSIAEFSVAATGSGPLTFQWRKNGQAIAGATASKYSTPPATLADNNASYTVVVTNSASSVTSSAAVLTVNAIGSLTTLSVNPTSPKVNDTIALTATVTQTGQASGIPAGDVEFLNGNTVLTTLKLDATGKATFNWKVPATPGSLSLLARFKGTSAVAGSTSAAVSVSVLANLTSGNRPPNEGEAARFLNQATFGATKASIDYLMQVGYDKWFEEQFGPDQDPTYIESNNKMWASGVPFALDPHHRYNYSGWYSVVVPGKSQLRFRMEWALSQIFVVSNNSIDSPQRLLYYGDLLRKNAFGTYRKLLGDVTFSAPMAIMLTYTPNFWNNSKTSNPDQNMARELMQLFSIGLWELNLDGTQKLQGGQPIPTYSSADIFGLSHVFTGLGTKEGSNKATAYVDRLMNPIESYPPGYRSQIQKRFLGVTIPASPNGTRLATDDIPIALDTVAAHPNVAPFLSKQLIQRFITSNPSPAYVERVARVWNNNGNNVRGDLKAVLKAILMDEEARNPALAFRPEAGKIREFTLRLGNFYRALNVTLPKGFLFGGNNDSTQYYQGYTSEVTVQTPYYAPTVFNWYRPGFAPPGTDLDKAGLLAPEMQIITTDTTLQWSNFVKDSLDRGGVGSMDYKNPTNPFQLDEWTNLATNTKQLVDRIDLLLFANQMSDTTRQALTKSVDGVAGNGTTAASRLNRVKVAFALAFVAPDYVVQK